MNERELKEKRIQWLEHCRKIQEASTVDPREALAIKLARISRAKREYAYFVETYFPHYASSKCGHFQLRTARRVKADPNIFAILEWPREHAKSVHADVLIPLWLMINDELTGMILVGKNEGDACGLLSDVQAELQYNQLFINDFGSQVTNGSWEDGDFITASGIEFIAVGRGQSPRGIRNREKRPNYCVVDDIDDDEIVQNPDRVQKTVDWILGSLYGALAIKQSRFVMVGNRIHKKSILAHIVGDIDETTPKRKGIFHSKVKALVNGMPVWKERYTLEELQRKFDRMGYYLTQREYFHNPVTKGKIFKQEWIVWGRVPKLHEFDSIVAYLDPSYKASTSNDYKACRVWGAKEHRRYLLKSFVRQCTITEVVKWMYDYHEATRDRCVINWYMEQVFLQDMFFDDFEAEAKLRNYYLPITGDTRKKPDKFVRVQALAPLYERGTIIYDERERSNHDTQTGLDQVLGFEKGSNVNDDAPDADEGALFILQKVGRVNTTEVRMGTRKTVGW